MREPDSLLEKAVPIDPSRVPDPGAVIFWKGSKLSGGERDHKHRNGIHAQQNHGSNDISSGIYN